MKFFIDTANIDQIKEAAELGILDGVTTNPSLMAKEGITGTENIYEHYKKICAIVHGDVSAEVISTDFHGIVEEGKKLADLAPNIVVKVPMIKDGVKALNWFSANLKALSFEIHGDQAHRLTATSRNKPINFFCIGHLSFMHWTL